MSEIRAAFQELITAVLAFIVGNPVTLVLLVAWIALMFTIGVITSMRWTGRKWRGRGARKTHRAAMHRWASTPRPPEPTSSGPTAPPMEPFPLRPAPGPRDW